jgi:hypothetical protein
LKYSVECAVASKDITAFSGIADAISDDTSNRGGTVLQLLLLPV